MNAAAARVAVVGSANLDVVVRSPKLPAPGETILGDSVESHPGGKGLNQALASASFVDTAFIGTVGTDSAGSTLLSAASAHGVDARYLSRTEGSSGTALIVVSTTSGENSIVVVEGANSTVTPSQVTQALDELRPTVVVAQLEIPAEAVAAAAEWARTHGARFVFNPSPIGRLTESTVDHPLRSDVALADPLIVNRGEGVELLGAHPGAIPIEDLADELGGVARSVIVTDGSRGAHIVVDGVRLFVPPTRVRAVDTTGAGDAFAGAVAALIADGRSLLEAAEAASKIAAHVVSTPRADRRAPSR